MGGRDFSSAVPETLRRGRGSYPTLSRDHHQGRAFPPLIVEKLIFESVSLPQKSQVFGRRHQDHWAGSTFLGIQLTNFEPLSLKRGSFASPSGPQNATIQTSMPPART